MKDDKKPWFAKPRTDVRSERVCVGSSDMSDMKTVWNT